jgi:NTP pyrophosphatase (non-canonical NTP hydrolase)
MIFSMDDKTTIKQLKKLVKEFCEEREWDQYHNAKDLAIGIITESSELLEHFRFKSVEEVNDFLKDKTKKEEISEELADVLFFILRLAQRYDIDLSSEFQKKMEKNTKKYPMEKAKGSNKKYTEYEK